MKCKALDLGFFIFSPQSSVFSLQSRGHFGVDAESRLVIAAVLWLFWDHSVICNDLPLTPIALKCVVSFDFVI